MTHSRLGQHPTLTASPDEETTYLLIGVIIPTLNRPDLLMERALRSAFGQTHPNLEVLVIVDDPDPGTQAALSLIHDPWPRLPALPTSPENP